MTNLIPTPEAVVVARATVVLGCIGSAPTAGVVLRLLWPTRPALFGGCYCTLLTAVTASAVTVGYSPFRPLDGLPELGRVADIVLLALAGTILTVLAEDLSRGRRVSQTWWTLRSALPRRRSQRLVGSSEVAGLRMLVAVAVLEELVFRGVGLQVAAGIPDTAAISGWLLLLTAAFALAHRQWGTAEVRGKMVLGLAALLVAIVSGTVVTAVLLHVAYNVVRWTDTSRGSRAEKGRLPGRAPIRTGAGAS